MTEGEVPSIDQLREERRRKEPPTLTDELADRIYGYISSSNLEGDIELRQMRIKPPSFELMFPNRSVREWQAKLYADKPPAGWEKLWESFTTKERADLSRALVLAIKAGYKTLGELKSVPEKRLAELPIGKPNIGIRAAFLKRAFGR